MEGWKTEVKMRRRVGIEGDEGEKLDAQPSKLPEAKQSAEESSPAYCSADPINNIPIPVICRILNSPCSPSPCKTDHSQ